MLKVYEYAAAAILLMAFGGFMYFKGYSGQHDALVSMEARTAQLGRDQAAMVAAYDKRIKENADDADKNATVIADGIHTYYLSHPVRVLDPNTSCGTATKTPGNPQGAGQAGGPEVPATQYASPYTPEETEQLASQLDQLLRLLHLDGVLFQ